MLVWKTGNDWNNNDNNNNNNNNNNGRWNESRVYILCYLHVPRIQVFALKNSDGKYC